jgi:hypothetical protein
VPREALSMGVGTILRRPRDRADRDRCRQVGGDPRDRGRPITSRVPPRSFSARKRRDWCSIRPRRRAPALSSGDSPREITRGTVPSLAFSLPTWHFYAPGGCASTSRSRFSMSSPSASRS